MNNAKLHLLLQSDTSVAASNTNTPNANMSNTPNIIIPRINCRHPPQPLKLTAESTDNDTPNTPMYLPNTDTPQYEPNASPISEDEEEDEEEEDDSESSESSISFGTLLRGLSAVTSATKLAEKGYKQERVITDTLQGQLIEATLIEDESQRFAIKMVEKDLHKRRIAKEKREEEADGMYGCQGMNGMTVMVEENIIKEASLLHHMTVANRSMGDYIASFIDFFQDDEYFYLVMEYAGDMNLAQFAEKAHQYIKEKKLAIKAWKKTVKFISWQLMTLLNWLHNDMLMAHLHLKAENIVIKNANFTQDADGKIMIDPSVQVKVVDWGLAEIFQTKDDMEFCLKHCFIGHSQYSAPKVFLDEYYAADKADIFSLGIILFKLCFNSYPYTSQNEACDEGFWSIMNHKLEKYVEINHCKKYTNSNMFSVIISMLEVDEDKRLNALQILSESKWFASYWNQYSSRIVRKSQRQKEKLKKQRMENRMKNLPFYGV